jgi:2-polyprenyl-6-hydroxyphenyl methylase/3-demethylubiquinone-9 3-methyltransferase
MLNVAKPDRITVDEAEVAAWNALAATWWNPNSETRWIHRYNPLRVGYIRDAACRSLGRDPAQPKSLAGLRVADIGCGGGILCEALAQLGATVVGVDPAQIAVDAAKLHAKQNGIQVDYRCTTADTLGNAGETFDVVCTMEVVEHVADAETFLGQCAALVKPGGLLVLSTINRTAKSMAFAIVLGEYVLRLLAVGTHQWSRFVTPAEVGAAMERSGMSISHISGVTMNIFARRMEFTRGTGVNYILTAERPAQGLNGSTATSAA